MMTTVNSTVVVEIPTAAVTTVAPTAASLTSDDLSAVRRMLSTVLDGCGSERTVVGEFGMEFDAFVWSEAELIGIALSMLIDSGVDAVLGFDLRSLTEDNDNDSDSDDDNEAKNSLANSPLLLFVSDVAAGYRHVPYHSFRHAVDVVVKLHHFMITLGLARYLTPFDVCAAMIAALCHDIGHPGVNNMFCVNSNDDLVKKYGEKAVLERYSCDLTLQLLERHQLLRNLVSVFAVSARPSFSATSTAVTDASTLVTPVATSVDHGLNAAIEEVDEDADEADGSPTATVTTAHGEGTATGLVKDVAEAMRDAIIECILHTDMTQHYSVVESCVKLGVILNCPTPTPSTESFTSSSSSSINSISNAQGGFLRSVPLKALEEDSESQEDEDSAMDIQVDIDPSTTTKRRKRSTDLGDFVSIPTAAATTATAATTASNPVFNRSSRMGSMDAETLAGCDEEDTECSVLSCDVFLDRQQRRQLCNVLLHAVDIFNPALPWTVSKKWSDVMVSEFFTQGDLEKAIGLPVSTNMDRLTSNQANINLGFSVLVVKPFFEAVADLVPEPTKFVDVLNNNIKTWKNTMADTPSAATPATSATNATTAAATNPVSDTPDVPAIVIDHNDSDIDSTAKTPELKLPDDSIAPPVVSPVTRVNTISDPSLSPSRLISENIQAGNGRRLSLAAGTVEVPVDVTWVATLRRHSMQTFGTSAHHHNSHNQHQQQQHRSSFLHHHHHHHHHYNPQPRTYPLQQSDGSPSQPLRQRRHHSDFNQLPGRFKIAISTSLSGSGNSMKNNGLYPTGLGLTAVPSTATLSASSATAPIVANGSMSSEYIANLVPRTPASAT